MLDTTTDLNIINLKSSHLINISLYFQCEAQDVHFGGR